jgi:hypothetical protein
MTDYIPKLGTWIGFGILCAYAFVTLPLRRVGLMTDSPAWADRADDRVAEAFS